MFQYCIENNGTLVEIWTEEKMNLVNAFVDEFETKNPQFAEHYWIGKLLNKLTLF